MSDYLDVNNEELLKDFFAEAEQQIENFESNILVIENDPANHEAIDEIFRAAHTLKGNSATVEMSELSEFTHRVEDLLDELRSDTIKVTEPVVDILFDSVDVIKDMLEARQNGSIYDKNTDDLVTSIKSFIPDKKNKKIKIPEAVKKQVAPVIQNIPKSVSENTGTMIVSAVEYAELKDACSGNQKLWGVAVTFDETNPMNSVGGIQVFSALKAVGSVLKTDPDFDVLYEDEFHQNVVYYLASDKTQDEIEDVSFLSDVTLSTDAQILKSGEHSNAEVLAAPVAVSNQVSVSTAPVAEKIEESKESVDDSTPKNEPVHEQEHKKTATTKVQSGSLLRVDSRRIDYLLNLVSETVITKASFNQIGMQMADLQVELQKLNSVYKEKMNSFLEEIPKYLADIQEGLPIKDIKAKFIEDFKSVSTPFDAFTSNYKSVSVKYRSSTQNLGRITSELQEGVMKIRMVPISHIFSRFSRVVRDLQKNLGKKMSLVLEGEETELDKSVIEDLFDPIMHCVRNSADHGIESPEERIAAGKPESGTITLSAANEGNMIIIEIIDDGAGIDVKKVREKAVSKGLISPNKVLSDQEAYQLIFHPGFSTSDKISSVSGRGVGLDVVKTMIDKLNGTVSVSSTSGSGSKFTIKLPLTLAIIQGLLVQVGREIYSIPIASVIESQRIKKEEINTIDNYEVLNVRNEVISILRLSRLFNIKEQNNSEYCFIVIVGSQDKKIGIMVDSLVGEEDVVIKPLRDQFTNSPGIAGASILGDGSVSLIIDVSQLLELGVRQELEAQKSLN